MRSFMFFLFIAFISFSGCKTSSGDASVKLTQTPDSASLPLAKAEFKINGMHCTGCENTIKNNVKEIKGITQVEASYKDNRAIVSYDSTKTNETAIVLAIEDAGYKVDTFMRK